MFYYGLYCFEILKGDEVDIMLFSRGLSIIKQE